MKSRPPRSRQSLTDSLFGLGWHSGTAEGFAALTAREIERLMDAARKSSRWGHRDATMILIGYRHGRGLCSDDQRRYSFTILCGVYG